MKKFLFSLVLIIFGILSCNALAAPAIKPAAGDTHPFVYLSDDFIAGLYNEDGTVKEAYATSYEYLKKLASNSPGTIEADPEERYLSGGISNRIMARALMYALGEYDYNHARATIEFTLRYLERPFTRETYSISMYKDIGTNGIQTGALVYDWCYDAMTPDERRKLANLIVAMYKDTESGGTANYTQPCQISSVNGWTDIAGKSVGQPLIYNCIAVTALYDIYPTYYENVMDKVQGTMAKALKAYGSAGALSDGSIAYTRDYYSYYIYILFQRLGASQKTLNALYGDQQALGYKMLYSRMPSGAMIRQGDGFSKDSYKVSVFSNGPEQQDLGLLASMYDNPYFKFEFYKENSGAQGVLGFLTMDCDVEMKFHDDLPLAYETKSPRTEIMTRTSWQDGITAPTAFAYMNMNERRTGDHDHADIGSFQLYYKGPLTMPAGVYAGTDWGQLHWRNYYTRTIAANCMTVYDPNEKFPWSNINLEANDGGQKVVHKWVIGQYASHFADSNIWAVTEGTFIGPNPKTPAFSYIKGDITKAYNSDKMESYKRGMVFMDTFNDTYPGVMLVFDRVVSTDASFEKRFLLQAVSDPEISGNKVTIVNDEDGCNGKLVNTTLLPKNVDIEKVGGYQKYIADGKEWPAPTDFAGFAKAYTSGFRLEISPKNENKEDLFLNAMYMTDADGNAPELPMIYEETNEFVGVTTLDRMVMFSKSGSFITNEFSVTVRNNNSGKNMICLITDITPGKWTVSGNGVNLTLESVEKDNCLTFSVAPGTYTIKPVDSSSAVTSVNWEEQPKQKFGDFVVKLDSGYMYLPDETYFNDDTAYLSAETCQELGKNISVETNGETVTVNRSGNISVIKVGELSYTYNGDVFNVNKPAIMHNDKVYIPVYEFCTPFAVDCSMAVKNKVLKVSSGKDVDKTNYLPPISSSGLDKISILSDGIIGESISVPANTSMIFKIGNDVKKIERVDVAGNGLGNGSFKIYYSLDGNSYYLLPHKLETATNNVYPFIANGDFYARYIKVCVTGTFKLREISLYGTDPDNTCFLVDKKIKFIDTSVDFETQVYISNGFNSAGIYIDETKVCDITENDDSVYNVVIPPEKLAEFAGPREIVLKVDFGNEILTDKYETTLVKGKPAIKIVDLDFDGVTSVSSIFREKTISGVSKYSPGNNLQNGLATDAIVDGKYKMTLKAPALGGPFFLINYMRKYDAASKTYLPINDGIFTAKCDIYFSSPTLNLTLEPRTKMVNNSNNTSIIYPKTGPSYQLFCGEQGLFEMTLEFDTINCLLRVYKRNIDEETGERAADKMLVKEYEFISDGLGQIRFTFINSSTTDEAYWTLDNYTVEYKEINFENIYFYQASKDLFATVNTQIYKGENVKILAVVKKDGKVCNFNIFTPVEDTASAEFDVPSDFFTAEGYSAELYVVSADNIMKILTKEVYSQ